MTLAGTGVKVGSRVDNGEIVGVFAGTAIVLVALGVVVRVAVGGARVVRGDAVGARRLAAAVGVSVSLGSAGPPIPTNSGE